MVRRNLSLALIAALGATLPVRAVAQQANEQEPNDSAPAATLVSLEQDIHGVIDQPGDVDYFAVDLQAGTKLEFYVRYPTNWTPTQWFIDRDGQRIIEQRDWSGDGEKLIRQMIPYRLVTIHNGLSLGIPTTPHTEIVELNRAGMGSPGVRAGVDLSVVRLASSQQPSMGSSYTNSLQMADAPSGIRWTVESGKLPPGLTLNATTGALSGVPTETGSFTFAVRPRSGSHVEFGRFTLIVGSAVALEIDPAPLRAGTVGSGYADTLHVTNAGGSVTWSVTQGKLPTGISLNSGNGVLSGTPSDTGSSAFTAAATSGPRSGSGQFTIHIAPQGTVAVAVADIVAALLGGPSLTAQQKDYLDSHGNHNGVLDVGDLRAYLRSQGQLSTPQH
jgi:hypothetical protein